MKSFDFKIKIQDLEKFLKIAVSAGKSLNFGANFIKPRFSIAEKGQTQKDLQDEIAHVVEELKKTDLRLFFALNGVLESLFKKGYKPCISDEHLWNSC